MSVYFIQADSGPMKIGHADDAAVRLRKLQCGSYERLRLIRLVEGGRPTERWLHRHFRSLHIRGEWFDFTHEMLTIEPPRLPEIRSAQVKQKAFRSLRESLVHAYELGLMTENEHAELVNFATQRRDLNHEQALNLWRECRKRFGRAPAIPGIDSTNSMGGEAA